MKVHMHEQLILKYNHNNHFHNNLNNNINNINLFSQIVLYLNMLTVHLV
jgi:hypothetical protein